MDEGKEGSNSFIVLQTYNLVLVAIVQSLNQQYTFAITVSDYTCWYRFRRYLYIIANRRVFYFIIKCKHGEMLLEINFVLKIFVCMDIILAYFIQSSH